MYWIQHISSIQRGQTDLLPTVSLLHSQLSQAAHYTHNPNTETVWCIVVVFFFPDLFQHPATSKPEEDKKKKRKKTQQRTQLISYTGSVLKIER